MCTYDYIEVTIVELFENSAALFCCFDRYLFALFGFPVFSLLFARFAGVLLVFCSLVARFARLFIALSFCCAFLLAFLLASWLVSASVACFALALRLHCFCSA